MNGELSFLSRCRISGSLNRRLSMSTSPSTSCRLRSPASHSRKRSTGSPDGSTGSTIISTSFAMTLHLQSADDFRTAGPRCEHGNCVCGRTHCHGRVDANLMWCRRAYISGRTLDSGHAPTRFPVTLWSSRLIKGKLRRRLLIGNFARLGTPRVGKPQCRTQGYDDEEVCYLSCHRGAGRSI